MVDEGKMKDAQPLEMEGSIVSYKNDSFIDGHLMRLKKLYPGTIIYRLKT